MEKANSKKTFKWMLYLDECNFEKWRGTKNINGEHIRTKHFFISFRALIMSNNQYNQSIVRLKFIKYKKCCFNRIFLLRKKKENGCSLEPSEAGRCLYFREHPKMPDRITVRNGHNKKYLYETDRGWSAAIRLSGPHTYISGVRFINQSDKVEKCVLGKFYYSQCCT